MIWNNIWSRKNFYVCLYFWFFKNIPVDEKTSRKNENLGKYPLLVDKKKMYVAYLFFRNQCHIHCKCCLIIFVLKSRKDGEVWLQCHIDPWWETKWVLIPVNMPQMSMSQKLCFYCHKCFQTWKPASGLMMRSLLL